MATTSDRLIGLLMIIAGLVIFAYYTTWTIVLVWVPALL
jgi:hypothetical protein